MHVGVNAAMEATISNFNVKSFIHSNKQPGIVTINSACELSDVAIDAKLSQFGPKGMHACIHMSKHLRRYYISDVSMCIQNAIKIRVRMNFSSAISMY